MKIDIHTHIMPKHIPDYNKEFGYSGFVTLEHIDESKGKMIKNNNIFRMIDKNCWDEKAILEDCAKFNIDLQVISTIPVLFNYWAKDQHTLKSSIYLNNHIADITNNYPKKFLGLGTLPMQNIDLAIKEMERCKNELGFKGIQIGSNINGVNLGDQKLYPFFEAAQDLEMSLMIHPWEMFGADRLQEYWMQWLVGMPAETALAMCSMIFSGLFEKLPKLKVLFSHAGGSFPAGFGRIEHGYNVRPDLVAVDNDINPRKYFKNFYLDSITHDIDILKYIIKMFGADRIALGSDYPFPLGELEPGRMIEESDLAQDTKDQLNYKTAVDWLNLDLKDFN